MKGKNLFSTKKNKLTALIIMILVLALLTGCSATENYSSDVEMVEDGYYGENIKEEVFGDVSSSTTTGESGSGSGLEDSRKLVKNYYIDAESKEFDTTLNSIYDKINSLGGYIEDSEISGNSYSYDRSRDARLVIRIPADKMTEFVTEVKAAGNVTSYREEVTDITLDYVDTQSHIEALEVERDALMEMLNQAGDLDTLLAIQNELTNVRYELEFYESAIRTFDQQVSYGTITLYLQEVIEITEQIGEETFFEELSRRFVDSVEAMIEIARELVILFVCMLPFLLPIAIVVAIIVVIIVLTDKKAKKKAAKRQKAVEAADKE